MRKVVLAALGLALAGCAGGVPVSRQVVVPGGQFQAVQGEAGLLVRTFVEDPAGERREVVGARCDIVSSLYQASVVTPSRLVVPNFGAQSPVLTADCRADKLAGSGSVRIITRWQQPPGYWGYPGWWGPWGMASPWGWDGPGFPISEYPDLIVTLR
jgi:hypothetical protein